MLIYVFSYFPEEAAVNICAHAIEGGMSVQHGAEQCEGPAGYGSVVVPVKWTLRGLTRGCSQDAHIWGGRHSEMGQSGP